MWKTLMSSHPSIKLLLLIFFVGGWGGGLEQGLWLTTNQPIKQKHKTWQAQTL